MVSDAGVFSILVPVCGLSIGMILALCGGAAAVLSLRHWRGRDRALPALALFACAGAADYLLNDPLTERYLTGGSEFWMTLANFPMLLLPVGFLWFIAELYEPARPCRLRRTAAVHAAGAGGMILAMLVVPLDWPLVFLMYFLVIQLEIGLAVHFLLRIPRGKPGRWMAAGLVVMSVLACWDTLYASSLLLEASGTVYAFSTYGIGVMILLTAFIAALQDRQLRTLEEAHQRALRLEEERNRLLEEARQTLAVRYEALRSQLGPHFLFNNLNTLLALIEENPRQAAVFTENLARVYRHVLQTAGLVLVPLGEELAFARSCLNMAQRRFEGKLVWDCRAGEDLLDRLLPPLSLQVLLENALKHNIISTKQPLQIIIEPSGKDRLAVRNTWRPKPAAPEGTGRGLANLVQRYALVTDQPVDIEQAAGWFSVIIPLLEEVPVHARTISN